ncbi:MAG: major capsid protein [Desulfovibrionaceae bacterium]
MRTLKKIAAEQANKQPQQVDSLTEEAPILNHIPFIETSHDLWNVYEDISDISGASWVEMNAPLPSIDMGTTLQKVDLAILGGEIEVPEDTATLFGGHQKYFARMMPKILRRSGMTAEQRIIYENFRAYALQEKKVVSAGATSKSDGECSSIIAVRFIEGETCGLYSPRCFVKGDILNTTAINNGGLYKSNSINHNNVLVYGVRMKAYMGIQMANSNSVAAIVNISKSAIPTAIMVDDLLAEVHAQPHNTFLFMHEKVRTLLLRYKAESLQITPEYGDFNRQITHWNGIPIVTSYNFKMNEEVVTLS